MREAGNDNDDGRNEHGLRDMAHTMSSTHLVGDFAAEVKFRHFNLEATPLGSRHQYVDGMKHHGLYRGQLAESNYPAEVMRRSVRVASITYDEPVYSSSKQRNASLRIVGSRVAAR